MIIVLLGALDVLVGLAFLLPETFANFFLLLGTLVLLKGIISIMGSISYKFYFDVLGAIDFIAGFLLIINYPFPLFGILPILKGVYSLIIGIRS